MTGYCSLAATHPSQANFVEYVPMCLILIALVQMEAIGSRWLAAAMGATLVIARLWHAQGLLSKEGVSAGRFMGTNLTGLVILCGAVACLGRGAGIW